GNFARAFSKGNALSPWIAGITTRHTFRSLTRTWGLQRDASIASVCGLLAIRIERWRWRMKESLWPSVHLIPSVWVVLIIRRAWSISFFGIGRPARGCLRK